MEVYVGNLPFETTLDEIRAMFVFYGSVYSVDLHTEREPGRPHAYAFVEMIADDAETAIEALDGTVFFGRTLRVEPAKDQVVKPE